MGRGGTLHQFSPRSSTVVPYEHAAQPHMWRVLLPPSFGQGINATQEGEWKLLYTGLCTRIGVRQNDSTGKSGLRCADSGHGYAGSGSGAEVQDERCAGIWAGCITADDRANLGSSNARPMWDCLLVFSNSSLTTRCSPFSPTIRTPMLLHTVYDLPVQLQKNGAMQV